MTNQTPATPGPLSEAEREEIQNYVDRCNRGEPGAALKWGLVRALLWSHAWRLREIGALNAANDTLAAENAALRVRAKRAEAQNRARKLTLQCVEIDLRKWVQILGLGNESNDEQAAGIGEGVEGG